LFYNSRPEAAMLVSINEDDPTPIYLQIARQIKEQILVGELCADEELPSVRELGDALGISLHTARSAYQSLSDEGLLRIRLGKRARVAAIPHAATSEVRDVEDGVLDAISGRMRDVVIDALLHGVPQSSIRSVLDDQIEELDARRTEATRRTGKEE
jgi:GntR family transcriptional regulator